MVNQIKQLFLNLPGWHTNRKIIVIESDDWGSIRMPNKLVYQKLIDSGVEVNKCSYCKNDSIENDSDLTMLFEILTSHFDSNKNLAVFTANTIMANPNFSSIKESNFLNYKYELFTKTYKRLGIDNMELLWKKGIESNCFFPQLHGREHLHVNRWLKFLQNNSKETLLAFENELFGLSTNVVSEKRKSFMAAFDIENIEDIEFHKNAIIESTEIFKNTFGFHSKSFIAPNYVWSHLIENELHECGVEFIQGSKYQRFPVFESIKKNGEFHYTGEKNKIGQIYTVRNCFFEPSTNPSFDWIGSCLNEISNSFLYKKPAIISSHRLNYIGSINPKNRNNNLVKLDLLLKMIIKKWPNVEFMNSVQLGEIIKKEWKK